MKQATLIFPHQLFPENPAIQPDSNIYLVEEWLFFRQYSFHKQKLSFHRASMKFYEDYLKKKGLNLYYIDSTTKNSDVRNLIPFLRKNGITRIHFTEVSDNWLNARIRKSSEKEGMETVEYDSPLFLNTRKQLEGYFNNKNKLRQTEFYIDFRRRTGLLTDSEGKPAGGKWTYDQENRARYPENKTPPDLPITTVSHYLTEAREYTERNYSGNYGKLSVASPYPINFEGARTNLLSFLQERFRDFGKYQDAIVKEETFLHHSILSPLVNTGILTPAEILDEILVFSTENDIPLNSLEGFIRQIAGWREFIRGVYEWKGSEQRTKNFWGFSRKIPSGFWTGTTGIDPVDNAIGKVLQTGYCHHIERLMVLGNFMLLCEFDPDEVYRWFMEMFIDAFDWVMVPNVYGMSQFADGGLMSTKPYISGSNYLMKMGNYNKGPWQEIWDALFWRFMDKQRPFFLKNPRLGMLVRSYDKMEKGKKERLKRVAEDYLGSLERN